MLGSVTVALCLCILELCSWDWSSSTINVWCTCFSFVFIPVVYDNVSYNVPSGWTCMWTSFPRKVSRGITPRHEHVNCTSCCSVKILVSFKWRGFESVLMWCRCSGASQQISLLTSLPWNATRRSRSCVTATQGCLSRNWRMFRWDTFFRFLWNCVC